MDYHSKYLKYKKKYTSLKAKMTVGSVGGGQLTTVKENITVDEFNSLREFKKYFIDNNQNSKMTYTLIPKTSYDRFSSSFYPPLFSKINEGDYSILLKDYKKKYIVYVTDNYDPQNIKNFLDTTTVLEYQLAY